MVVLGDGAGAGVGAGAVGMAIGATLGIVSGAEDERNGISNGNDGVGAVGVAADAGAAVMR